MEEKLYCKYSLRKITVKNRQLSLMGSSRQLIEIELLKTTFMVKERIRIHNDFFLHSFGANENHFH